MPLGTYYGVTGSDPAALDIRRAAPVQREARPEVEKDSPLMRELTDQYRKELDQANAIFEARKKDIRPWENEQDLYESIVVPVLNKWRQVPGFQGSAGIEIERMRQTSDARNAANRMVQQQSVARDREAMMNSGASETQATIQAALRNNLTGSSGFKFPGFFYAGTKEEAPIPPPGDERPSGPVTATGQPATSWGTPLPPSIMGEAAAFDQWKKERAEAEAEWKRKHPAPIEVPVNATTERYSPRSFLVGENDPTGLSAGQWELDSAGAIKRIAGLPPSALAAAKRAAASPSPAAVKASVEARGIRAREMAALLKANPWLVTGELPSSWTSGGKAKSQAILDKYMKLRAEADQPIDSDIEEEDAVQPEPQMKTFQAGQYRVTIK